MLMVCADKSDGTHAVHGHATITRHMLSTLPHHAQARQRYIDTLRDVVVAEYICCSAEQQRGERSSAARRAAARRCRWRQSYDGRRTRYAYVAKAQRDALRRSAIQESAQQR